MALLGFLRLSTRNGIFARPLGIEQALSVVDVWLSQPTASILNPTDRHSGVLGRLLLGAGSGGNLVSDAHLAALAIEHGAELGTFDRDFARFAGLRLQWLA
jgi:toxin-antitoxin system PIN domain toxin